MGSLSNSRGFLIVCLFVHILLPAIAYSLADTEREVSRTSMALAVGFFRECLRFVLIYKFAIIGLLYA